MRATSVLRHSPWDGTLVALSLLHAVALVTLPSIPLIAIGLWWNANTISHNFIHLPFFRSRRMNDLFAFFLTLLLGFPQHLWRARHLAHHAGKDAAPVRWTRRLYAEAAFVVAMWAALAIVVPRIFFFVYLPGYLIGLGLCQLQGHFEHAHGTTSHYGRIYNTLFFRDGFHVEHHAKPTRHWLALERMSVDGSAFPPVLRWLDEVPAVLDLLERGVLRFPLLQSVVIRSHTGAFEKVLAGLSGINRVAIIGGGLFPRTAIIIRQLLPDASITIIDRNPASLESARRFLGNTVTALEGDCDASRDFDADLVIVPLAFVGDRIAFYERPPAEVVIVHDWIWRRRGESTRVAWWLLKRVNVVRRSSVRRTSRPVRPASGRRAA